MATYSAGHGDMPQHVGGAVHPSTGAAPVPFWQLATLGLVTALFGIVVLAWPGETLRVLGALVGVWLVVAGAMRVATTFGHSGSLVRRLLTGAVGVVLVLGGVACLRNVANGVVVLAAFVGLAWMLTGVAEIGVGLLTTGRARVGLLTIGIVSILAGLLFVLWPGVSLTVVVLLTGVSALVIGVGEVALAIVMRREAATRTAASTT